MNLVIIIGSGAVGKMTVGQELMKITNYRLFHNHHMIEPVIDIFGYYDGNVVKNLRELIFESYIQTNNTGLIFTYMWAFDSKDDWNYIESVAQKFELSGGKVYWVELIADQKIRLERNKTDNRLQNKASKRDLLFSQERIIQEEKEYRLVSRKGEIPYKNYVRIDNANLSAEVVASMIKDKFGLK